MAILLLTPRIYRNMKWSITPKDMFDTVSMSPITNAYENEASSLATEDITTVTINGHTYNLANIGDDLAAFNNLQATYRRNVDNDDLAYSRIDVLMVSGKHRFVFQNPISPQNLSAAVTLAAGVSCSIARGSKTNDYFPLSDLHSNSFSLASWIQEHKEADSNRLEWQYGSNSFVFNPWAYGYGTVYPLGESSGALLQKYTEWYGSPSIGLGYRGPFIQDWHAFQNYSLEGDTFTYINGSAGQAGIPIGLEIRNSILPITTSVQKIDDYTVDVYYTVPVRLAYLATSAYYNAFSYHAVDNRCFLDRMTKITIQLNGLTLDTTGNDISYSLNETGTGLTEQTINKRIYKVEKNELFTLNTYYGNNTAQKWSSKFALEFLQKYQKGKYLLNLDVPAKWAIENQIHCNSQLKIKLQDNTYIERKGSHCVFEVKTIEKSFRNNEFTFSLGLLEV